MPHRLDGESKGRRRRRYLEGAGVTREDSDDELGLEDLPWYWIYSKQVDANDDNDEEAELQSEADALATLDGSASARKDGPTRSARRSIPRSIIGARMGNFECRIGDCVLLKAEGNNEAWVGLICEFIEDEEEGMVANFMWFSTEKEIRNKSKKRTDFMQVHITTHLSQPFIDLLTL